MNSLIIPYDEIITAIHAHTALMAIGARNLEDIHVPAILHSDHDTTLVRVARDAAAIIAPRFASAGVTSITDSPDGTALTVTSTAPLPPALPPLIAQAVKFTVLQIAYAASGLPADTHRTAADAAITAATATISHSPATITPWP